MSIKLPREREIKVQRSGIVRLRRMGVALFRRNVGGMQDRYGHHVRFAAPGQSDTYGWIISTGRHVEIEWKRPGNKPTEAQMDWLMECTRLGAVAFWSDNVETAEIVMRAILAGGHIVWVGGVDYDVI